MTTENIFSAVLTFSLMAGGTVAFGADLLRTKPAPAAVATATLPPVTVIGRRIASADRVTLPSVTVIGRRVAPTKVAVETGSVEQRVQ
jgi:hypothetical protein